MKIEAGENSIGFKNPEENRRLPKRILDNVNFRILLLVLASGVMSAGINDIYYNETPNAHNTNKIPFSSDGKGMGAVIQPEN